jgi:flavin reductase ActVB
MVALLECRLVDRIPGGDHVILIGEVYVTEVSGGQPLVYHQRGFPGLSPAALPQLETV